MGWYEVVFAYLNKVKVLLFGNQRKYDESFSGQPSRSEYYQAYVCSGLMKQEEYVLTYTYFTYLASH